jgi:hypothetical protein
MEYIKNTQNYLKQFEKEAHKLICDLESLGAIYILEHQTLIIDSCPEFVFTTSYFQKICRLGIYIQFKSKVFGENILIGFINPKFKNSYVFYNMGEVEQLAKLKFSHSSLRKIHFVKKVFKGSMKLIG